MAGINRAFSINESLTKAHLSANKTCVFISHQKRDAEFCEKIAKYLMQADIDVYFDEYDNDLKHSRINKDPKGVVDCIRKGISKSTHMLCVLSPNTLDSRWVPWEVGYGYDKTKVGALTLKGISDSEIPDYLKTVKIIRGTKSLNAFISELTGFSELILETKKLTLKASTISHPLDNVLDWNA